MKELRALLIGDGEFKVEGAGILSRASDVNGLDLPGAEPATLQPLSALIEGAPAGVANRVVFEPIILSAQIQNQVGGRLIVVCDRDPHRVGSPDY